MRISDWSSDVCSSDLTGTDTEEGIYLDLNKISSVNAQLGGDATTLETVAVTASRMLDTFNPDNKGVGTSVSGRQLELTPQSSRSVDDIARLDPRIQRSEEHTYELQSLMRTSYAVFGLQKK